MKAVEAAFLAAIRDGDRHRAYATVDAALEECGDLALIYLDLLQPALRGLGLAISSRLANAMHGTLSATSEPDVGSRFALHLPPAASGSTAGLKDT